MKSFIFRFTLLTFFSLNESAKLLAGTSKRPTVSYLKSIYALKACISKVDSNIKGLKLINEEISLETMVAKITSNFSPEKGIPSSWKTLNEIFVARMTECFDDKLIQSQSDVLFEFELISLVDPFSPFYNNPKPA